MKTTEVKDLYENKIASLEHSREKIADRLNEIKDYQHFIEERVNSYSKDILKQNHYIKELEQKIFNLEYKNGVLWRWCIINSILILVFALSIIIK